MCSNFRPYHFVELLILKVMKLLLLALLQGSHEIYNSNTPRLSNAYKTFYSATHRLSKRAPAMTSVATEVMAVDCVTSFLRVRGNKYM